MTIRRSTGGTSSQGARATTWLTSSAYAAGSTRGWSGEPSEAVKLGHGAGHDEAVVGVEPGLVGILPANLVGEGEGVDAEANGRARGGSGSMTVDGGCRRAAHQQERKQERKPNRARHRSNRFYLALSPGWNSPRRPGWPR